MQACIADLVHPIFRRVLELRDRLSAGESPLWDDERSALRELLDTLGPGDTPARNAWPDQFAFSEQGAPEDQRRLTQATIRYVLTCWLDEYLGQHSAWGPSWREQPLEAELYGTLQGRKFWDEARYAETRGDRDTLEVVFWCAALGYNGAWRGMPQILQAWQARVQELLDRTAPVLALPASRAPSSLERALPTDLSTRRLAFSLLLGVSLAAPLLAVLLWRW
jgi:type VI protein secretion system component VasF